MSQGTAGWLRGAALRDPQGCPQILQFISHECPVAFHSTHTFPTSSTAEKSIPIIAWRGGGDSASRRYLWVRKTVFTGVDGERTGAAGNGGWGLSKEPALEQPPSSSSCVPYTLMVIVCAV